MKLTNKFRTFGNWSSYPAIEMIIQNLSRFLKSKIKGEKGNGASFCAEGNIFINRYRLCLFKRTPCCCISHRRTPREKERSLSLHQLPFHIHFVGFATVARGFVYTQSQANYSSHRLASHAVIRVSAEYRASNARMPGIFIALRLGITSGCGFII